jgi:hypothetical protein
LVHGARYRALRTAIRLNHGEVIFSLLKVLSAPHAYQHSRRFYLCLFTLATTITRLRLLVSFST